MFFGYNKRMSKKLDKKHLLRTVKQLMDHFPYKKNHQWAIYLPEQYHLYLGKLKNPFYYAKDIKEPFIAASPHYYLHHPDTLLSVN